MKIAVIGANGQLGFDLVRTFREYGLQVIEFNQPEIDVTEAESLAQKLAAAAPDVVVNTAAFHNVELCETEREKSFAVNALGAANLARSAAEHGFRLVHISTDYVFGGEKNTPYLEDDPPLPLNVYANSKLAGEYFVRALAPDHWILRVSGIYGVSPCLAKGYSFVDLMVKLAGEREKVRVVTDERLTPTPTREIARQIAFMLEKGAPSGIYHVTAEGDCSWYEFAAEIFKTIRSGIKLEAAEPGEFAVRFQRPKYSVLENGNLKKLGLNRMVHWRDGLHEYLKEKHPDLF